MIRKVLGILLLTPAALAQIQPDVSYTGNNDRFDISRMLKAKNKMFRDTPQLDDEEDDGLAIDDNRRYQGSEETLKLKDALGNITPPKVILNRRADGNDTKFAVNDTKFAVNDTKFAVNDTKFADDTKLVVNDTKIADDTKLAVNDTKIVDDTEFADETKFAEDDTNNSFEGGTVSDFEENLKKFQVN